MSSGWLGIQSSANYYPALTTDSCRWTSSSDVPPVAHPATATAMKALSKFLFAARLVLCAALLWISVAAPASASPTGTVPGAAKYPQGPPGSITDTRVHVRDPDLTVLLWLPYYYGVGFGIQVRYEFRVLPDGFIPSINDEFTLEPSFGVAGTSYGYYATNYGIVNLTPALYGLWRFHFLREFDAYVGLGLGVNIGIPTRAYGGFTPTYFYWDPCIGVTYRFAPSIAVRGQLGAQGLMGGLSFFF
jgi:hypothetical protein